MSVHTRNISQLLNIVSSCSVTEFKDTGLEYLCLQLECMLENHLLDNLDEDLLLELDKVVRENQLNCLPFAKSGRAELLLHERHPSLAGEIDEERERRIRDIAFRETLNEDSRLSSSSYRARIGSLDDIMSRSPSQDKARRKSKAARNAPFSPTIRPKDSTIDLMFDMDDDDSLAPGSPKSTNLKPTSDIVPTINTSPANIPAVFVDGGSPTPQEDDLSSLSSRHTGLGIRNRKETPSPVNISKTWSSPNLTPTKLGMKEIMAQASSSRTSNLSMSLSAQKAKDDAGEKLPPPKLSQKERRKQQQSVAQSQIGNSEVEARSSSPWKLTTKGTKTSLKDILGEPESSPSPLAGQTLGLPTTSHPPTPRRTASPDTRFAGQSRAVSTKREPSSSPHPSRISSPLPSQPSPTILHPKLHLSPTSKAEPSLQLSMADIIGQQKREQEVIKDAVAKRSLQEIQEEQAFQEWWDQESRRAQEEEALRAKGSGPGASKGNKTGSGRGKGGARERGGRGGARRGRGQDRSSGGA